MIVIGTAGHIDHGKSSIVRRLTGSDPDRLPEEKARGMTIDLGFAFYRTPEGDDLAFVDVPGHERFVKNMIAGAGGIDAVMLVVAADDGWMPQSEEHFQITRLLGVKYGLIVINKIDLVDSDWVELLEQDVREKVIGSFLESADIVKVSAETGDGFEQLTSLLNQLPRIVRARSDIGKARLYIDRSFVRPGMGGVVTGTLRGGRLTVGQNVSIWPSMARGKVRTLQTHNEDVQESTPGQRTAVSFTGVERDLLVRGGVVSGRTDLAYFRDNPVLALSVELLKNAAVGLENRRRVLVIAGTTEAEGEIRIYDREQIQPGERGLVLFNPDDPVYTLVGDHVIVRLPTPMVTLGGGRVLDHLPHFPRRRDWPKFAYLNERTDFGLESLIVTELEKRVMVKRDELLTEADFSAADIDKAVTSLIEQGTAGSNREYVYLVDAMEQLKNSVKERVTRYFADNPHHKGIPLETMALLVKLPDGVLMPVLTHLLDEGVLVRKADLYDLEGRGMSLKGVIKEAHDNIMAELRAEPYTPPALSQLAARGKVYQQAIKYILDSGEGYKCGSDFIYLSETWDEITAFIRDRLAAHGKMSVGELRDRFGITRKFAIPILEECDRIGLTAREGDYRVKGDRYD